MGNLRQDPTTAEWVIVSPERSSRPAGIRRLARAHLPSFDAGCPFCPGNEETTPPEIARTSLSGEWQHRIVPNKYPALTEGGNEGRRGEHLALEMDGLGAHEVIVDARRHDQRLDEMPLEQLTSLIRLWRDRARVLAAEPWARAVVVLRNFGAGAGSSLDHPHSQIIATPVCPPEHRNRAAIASAYHDRTGGSLYRDVLDHELRVGDRVIVARDRYVALAPFASRHAFETWVMPRAAQASFTDVSDDALPELARVLRDILVALRRAAGDPDHNLVIRSAPIREGHAFQWHLVVVPRMSTAAGFELGTGMAINSVAPEDAAAAMRDALAHVSAA